MADREFVGNADLTVRRAVEIHLGRGQEKLIFTPGSEGKRS